MSTLSSSQKASLATMTSQLQAASKQLSAMQAAKASGSSSGGSTGGSSGSSGTYDPNTDPTGEAKRKLDAVAAEKAGKTNSQSTQDTSTSAPNKNLKPGDSGMDVQALQDYLIQHGYATPDQFAGGAGTYGPQTTAAVVRLQEQLGLQPQTGKGYYGPQTQAALKQKYQTAFNKLNSSGAAPDQASAGLGAVQGMVQAQDTSDPAFSAMSSAIAPIMGAMQQVLNNINNPAITGTSLQTEYNTLAQQAGIPQLQTQMLNMQNVMNGTEQDIRDEITKAGGTATDSQVLALAGARNNVILKQYNALATNFQAATTNVQNMMQYASSDQSVALQKENMTASITESMASISSQMMNMGMTMQQHASDNLNKVVTNVGYQGLAMQAKDNPAMLSYYEKMLGLSDGSLSNPASLSKLETLRQQQLALGQQKVNIQMYNAGLSSGGSPYNTPGGYVTQPSTGSQALVSLNDHGNDSQGRPYALNSNQAQNLLKGGATIDAGTKNIVVPGVGYYVAQGDGSYRLSIDPGTDEGKFIQMRNRAENPQPFTFPGGPSQQRMAKNAMTRQVTNALSAYKDSPLYKNMAASATYFAKLNAGLQNPGSVGDPDIIDSLVKINTGGQGAITEQQYSAYAQGQTWGDRFQVVGGKVVAKGGTLSPAQRTEIRKLANDTYSQYRSEYQVMYTQAMENLDHQQVPDAFWGNMPDWSSLVSGTVTQ